MCSRPKKPTRKPKPRAWGLLRLPGERRIVERELLERLLQRLVLVAVDGEQAREHHGLGPRDSPAAAYPRRRERRSPCRPPSTWRTSFKPVTKYPTSPRKARAAAFQPGGARPPPPPAPRARGHHEHLVALLHGAVHHAHKRHHAAIRVEVRVEDKRAQRRVRAALRRGDVVDHGLQEVVHARAGLARGEHRIVGGNGQASSISSRTRSGSAAGRSILLMSGMISRLAFMAIMALATVCASTPCVASTTSTAPLAGGQTAAHLVGEVHVPRRVDEVELVVCPSSAV